VIPLPVDELRGLGELDAAAGEITGVRVDSRLVSAAELFVAVPGGEPFVADARARGASTLVPRDAFAALAAIARKVRDRSEARLVGSPARTGRRRRRTSSPRSPRHSVGRSPPSGASTTRSACRSRSAGSSRHGALHPGAVDARARPDRGAVLVRASARRVVVAIGRCTSRRSARWRTSYVPRRS